MISSVLTFITTPFGKIVSYIIGILLIIGIAFTALKIHDNNIRKEVLNKFNRQQIEATLESTKKLLKQNEEIIQNQNEILKSVKEKNDKLESSLTKIDEFLNAPETIKTDKESSNILKQTVKSLKEIK